MELDKVREKLDIYDNIIKDMITLRMSLIPIVTDIKVENNLPLHQAKREDEIYKNIEIYALKNGVDKDLVTDVYKRIIKNALDIEEGIASGTKDTIINKDIGASKLKNIENEFEKLDEIIKTQIPQIMSNIKNECDKLNLNMTDGATLYYNRKINND